MQLLNYKKSKKNTYLVTLSNQEELLLYDDIIVKYALIPKKEISDDLLKQIRKENYEKEAYYKALQYITVKLRTKKEVQKQLKKYNYEPELINKAIDKLENEKYLDERKYAIAFLNDSYRFSNDGPNRIKNKLEQLGIPEEFIYNALNTISNDQWKEKLEHILKKKAMSKHNDSLQRWKLKCFQYCYNLGYQKELINDLMNQISWQSEEEELKKDYQKYKKKLERKYEGKELNYQIRKKLYERGYQLDNIDFLE